MFCGSIPTIGLPVAVWYSAWRDSWRDHLFVRF